MWGFPVDFPLNQSIDSLDQTTNFRKKKSEKCGKTMDWLSREIWNPETMGFSHEDHGAVRFHFLKDQPAFPGKNVETWWC